MQTDSDASDAHARDLSADLRGRLTRVITGGLERAMNSLAYWHTNRQGQNRTARITVRQQLALVLITQTVRRSGLRSAVCLSAAAPLCAAPLCVLSDEECERIIRLLLAQSVDCDVELLIDLVLLEVLEHGRLLLGRSGGRGRHREEGKGAAVRVQTARSHPDEHEQRMNRERECASFPETAQSSLPLTAAAAPVVLVAAAVCSSGFVLVAPIR